MNINEAFPSKYLSTTDLKGRPARVIVDRIEMGQFNDGKSKPIVFFQGKQKGLALNKTNANAIQNTYGPDTDNWIGADLELFEAIVDFKGNMVPAIRVRVPPRQVARSTAGPVNNTPAPARPVPRQPEPPVTEREYDDDIPF